MRKLVTLAALLLIAAAPLARAEDGSAGQVKEITQALADRTVAAAKVDDPGERRKMLQEAAGPAMDMQAIGKGVLDYAGARVPPGRKSDIMAQVVSYVGDKITDEIERIRPEKATVGDVEVKGNEAHVNMQLAGLQDSIDIRWLFRKTEAGWRIIDGAVSGTMLTMHFGEKLARYAHGVEQLEQYLRDQRKVSQTASRI